MIFTRTEIEVLRLCAWCKDLPTGGAEILPENTIRLLLILGLIRKSRCGLSDRITSKGNAVLQAAGFFYEPDKQYLGKSQALIRRLCLASLTSFFWRIGADVFCDAPGERLDDIFLPSFALRRKVSTNLLGGTRLAGFYYSGNTAFIPYCLMPDDDGLYAEAEQRIFKSEALIGKRQPFVIYSGLGTLEQILETILCPKEKKARSTTDTYWEALKKFTCPMGVVPLNENGMRQLRILGVPCYREKLIHQILGKDYLPSLQSTADGCSASTKENFLIGIDCDVNRFERAIRKERKKVHIILLSSQLRAIRGYLKGKNAILHSLDTEIVEQALGLPKKLSDLDLSPFQKQDGEYLYVPDFDVCPKI